MSTLTNCKILMNTEYKSKQNWNHGARMTTQDSKFKDLFIAKCVQIPQAEQKAASPEQLHLTSTRLPLPRI